MVVKPHKTPRSYVVATLDGIQVRRNRVYLLPTKEGRPIISPAIVSTGDDCSTPLPVNDDEVKSA